MPLSFTGLSLFEAYVEKVMRAYDACGMAVAIVDQGQPVQELFYGFRDREQKLPINRIPSLGWHPLPNPSPVWQSSIWPSREKSTWTHRIQPIYSIFS